MKKDIHPAYHKNATITCACGAVYAVGSTKEKMDIEVCSQCHYFYTGDTGTKATAGQVEKFKARQAAAAKKGGAKKKNKKK